jgi:hypothetical protein
VAMVFFKRSAPDVKKPVAVRCGANM